MRETLLEILGCILMGDAIAVAFVYGFWLTDRKDTTVFRYLHPFGAVTVVAVLLALSFLLCGE